ncbi:MAG: hypothetical protein Kow006_15770 [Gammaproteobacteria bacterium]
MTNIRLTIPDRNELPDPRIETRPAELRRFLEELPFTDPARTCEIAASELAALNRQQLSPQARLPLAELHRQTFRKLMQLQSRLLRGGIAVRQSKRATEALKALARLARELSFAFKIIVTDILAEGEGRSGRNLQASVFRAIKFLGLEQLFSFHAYLPASSHVWRELNQLLGLAIEKGIAESPYIDDENRTLPSSSIAHVYKQIALTGRSDPYHLGNGEAWKVYDFLDRWSELAKISKKQADRTSGQFLIDFEGNTAPKPISSAPGDFDSERHRILDTQDLAHWIDAQIHELDLGNLTVAENIHLDVPTQEIARVLRYLMLTWWHCPTRQHERRERLTWVEGVCGLSATYQLLREAEEELPVPTQREDDSIEISTSGALRRSSISGHLQQERWRLINHSTGGVALGVQLPCNPSMRVGQLIIFRHPASTENTWLFGIIRWLSQEQEDEIRVGVQYLSDRATPVALRDPDSESNRPLAALEISIQQANRPMPPQLVTPHGIYRPGKEVFIKEERQQIRIRAAKLIEATSSLDRFYFEKLEN